MTEVWQDVLKSVKKSRKMKHEDQHSSTCGQLRTNYDIGNSVSSALFIV